MAGREHAVRDTTVDGYAAVALASPDEDVCATFVPEAAMVGCSLRAGGDELLAQRGGVRAYAERASTMGIPLLHPWANRLADWDYGVGDRVVALDRDSELLKPDEHGIPIHGVQPRALRFSVVDRAAGADAARVRAELEWNAPELLEIFPFPHALAVDVRLADRRLSVETALRPTGDVAVPVSFGYHPYLTLPGVPRAEWEVGIPARERLVLDGHAIPTGEREPFEWGERPLGDTAFDDGLAALARPARFTLRGGGREIALELAEGYDWAQVYSPADQSLICFEPMTAPTNALRTGGDALALVAPGASYRARFEIRVSERTAEGIRG